jgi:mRNA interferase HigB
VFNIITRRTLLEYCKKYPVAATALFEWYHELVLTGYKNFNELKSDYPNGIKFRLIVRIVFEFKSVQIKWFGTHTEYDKINVETIQYKKK